MVRLGVPLPLPKCLLGMKFSVNIGIGVHALPLPVTFDLSVSREIVGETLGIRIGGPDESATRLVPRAPLHAEINPHGPILARLSNALGVTNCGDDPDGLEEIAGEIEASMRERRQRELRERMDADRRARREEEMSLTLSTASSTSDRDTDLSSLSTAPSAIDTDRDRSSLSSASKSSDRVDEKSEESSSSGVVAKDSMPLVRVRDMGLFKDPGYCEAKRS